MSVQMCEVNMRAENNVIGLVTMLPERPQKPIELATIKQQKENCKNEKIQKKVIKNDFKNIKKNIKEYAARKYQ